jgi:hypothetical protein
MAVYSDVLELLQISGNGACAMADIEKKLGYTAAQVSAAVAQYRHRTRERLYVVGMDNVVRITGEGKRYRINDAHITRSDVGASKEETIRMARVALPLVDGLAVMKNGVLLIELTASGISQLAMLSEWTGMEPMRIMQVINIINMRVNAKLLIAEVSKARTYSVRPSGDASSFVVMWNELLRLASDGDQDAIKRLYQLCGISYKQTTNV